MISNLLRIAVCAAAVTAVSVASAKTPDYTEGHSIWFDKVNPSNRNVAVWKTSDGNSAVNPDTIWERYSLPIGNGSFGANVIGSVERERVTLNEKSLWRGGPAVDLDAYWNMNREVPDTLLQHIRALLDEGQNAEAGKLVSKYFRGNVDYTGDLFGSFTTLGEAYVTTGIPDNAVTNYKRILNLDQSIAVVEFDHAGSKYQRRYFASYPDSVMVWRFTPTSAPQTLTFAFDTPQHITSVTKAGDGLIYSGCVDNNGMKWAMRVLARTADGRGSITADRTNGTITVAGSRDVEFLLAADTDYRMNLNPDYTDATTYTGGDPLATVNADIDAAAAMPYSKLYDRHLADYRNLYDRVKLQINPTEKFKNLPTPERLNNYRAGVLDHGLEQNHFQFGRYLLISSSRKGNLPANLQGVWHNNILGPWF
ncbi:MAG: glycoside hydrolase family 95 protein, partial [Muribaculaceae bacterium]|nr:glycoside hydrolase family 95 protein [Muribaculaceae bacterium]